MHLMIFRNIYTLFPVLHFGIDIASFSFLQDALSYSGKACLRFSYMPFRIPIRAFPHAGKAFFVHLKRAYTLMVCAIR